MPKSPQNENSNPFFATGRHFLRARMARRSRFFSIQDDSLPVARHTEEPGLGTSLRPGPGLQYPPTGPLPEVARMRNFVQATALRSEASILQESLPDTSRHASRPQHFSAPLRGAPSQAHQCVRACVPQANVSRLRSRWAEAVKWTLSGRKPFLSFFGKRSGGVPPPAGPPDATESDVELADFGSESRAGSESHFGSEWRQEAAAAAALHAPAQEYGADSQGESTSTSIQEPSGGLPPLVALQLELTAVSWDGRGGGGKNGVLASSRPYFYECGVLRFVLQQDSQHSKSPFKKTTNPRRDMGTAKAKTIQGGSTASVHAIVQFGSVGRL